MLSSKNSRPNPNREVGVHDCCFRNNILLREIFVAPRVQISPANQSLDVSDHHFLRGDMTSESRHELGRHNMGNSPPLLSGMHCLCRCVPCTLSLQVALIHHRECRPGQTVPQQIDTFTRYIQGMRPNSPCLGILFGLDSPVLEGFLGSTPFVLPVA